jgi:2-polyprenyl-6-methoxyphenol hydroxylase-like FAD-dependent oxidoreductase
MSTPNTPHYDVIIAGARCAGAATALLLARQGARVLLLDKSRYGTDTLSTHALMRGAVLQLDRWGLLPSVAGAGTPPVRSA